MRLLTDKQIKSIVKVIKPKRFDYPKQEWHWMNDRIMALEEEVRRLKRQPWYQVLWKTILNKEI